MNNGKAWAGVFIASVVVVAYIGIGFVNVLAAVFFGVDVKFPPDWSSAMLSLASAALGFLIGKHSLPNSLPGGTGGSDAEVLGTERRPPATTPVATRPQSTTRPPQ